MQKPTRDFGDHMADEGESSQIHNIIITMYCLLFGYSMFASYVTGDRWYTQIIFYFVVLIMFYIWHFLAHQKKFIANMYKIHMQHHHGDFPASNFYGKTEDTVKICYGKEIPTLWDLMDPRKSTNFTFDHEGILYVMLITSLLIAKIIFNYSFTTILFFTFMAILMGSVGSALHSSFHVKGFQLEKYQWYMELRTIHYLHHLGSTKHNFAVFNVGLDWVFGTLIVFDPAHEKNEVKQVTELPHGITKKLIKMVSKTGKSISQGQYFLDQVIKEDNASVFIIPRLCVILIGIILWNCDFDSKAKTITFEHYDSIQNFVGWFIPNIFRLSLFNFRYFLSDICSIVIIISSFAGQTMVPITSLTSSIIVRSILAAITPMIMVPSLTSFESTNLESIFSNESVIKSYLSPHLIVAVTFWMQTNIMNAKWKYFAIFNLIFQIVISLGLKINWTTDVICVILMTTAMFTIISRAIQYVGSWKICY
jgi:sterol desaturase/sphingolipid hydroxylase (fatty acid hydroxylase superfamily)